MTDETRDQGRSCGECEWYVPAAVLARDGLTAQDVDWMDGVGVCGRFRDRPTTTAAADACDAFCATDGF